MHLARIYLQPDAFRRRPFPETKLALCRDSFFKLVRFLENPTPRTIDVFVFFEPRVELGCPAHVCAIVSAERVANPQTIQNTDRADYLTEGEHLHVLIFQLQLAASAFIGAGVHRETTAEICVPGPVFNFLVTTHDQGGPRLIDG